MKVFIVFIKNNSYIDAILSSGSKRIDTTCSNTGHQGITPEQSKIHRDVSVADTMHVQSQTDLLEEKKIVVEQEKEQVEAKMRNQLEFLHAEHLSRTSILEVQYEEAESIIEELREKLKEESIARKASEVKFDDLKVRVKAFAETFRNERDDLILQLKLQEDSNKQLVKENQSLQSKVSSDSDELVEAMKKLEKSEMVLKELQISTQKSKEQFQKAYASLEKERNELKAKIIELTKKQLIDKEREESHLKTIHQLEQDKRDAANNSAVIKNQAQLLNDQFKRNSNEKANLEHHLSIANEEKIKIERSFKLKLEENIAKHLEEKEEFENLIENSKGEKIKLENQLLFANEEILKQKKQQEEQTKAFKKKEGELTDEIFKKKKQHEEQTKAFKKKEAEQAEELKRLSENKEKLLALADARSSALVKLEKQSKEKDLMIESLNSDLTVRMFNFSRLTSRGISLKPHHFWNQIMQIILILSGAP